MYNSDFGRRLRTQAAAKSSPTRRHGQRDDFASSPGASSSNHRLSNHLPSDPHSYMSEPSTSAAVMPGSWNAFEANGPAGSSRTVGLEEGSVSRNASPLASSRERPRTPSKRNTQYADRYIPNREATEAQVSAFQLMDGTPSTPQRQKRKMAPEMDAEQEEADHAFANLLNSEIFGQDGPSAASSSAPSSGSRSSSRPSANTPSTPTKKNLFSFSSPSSSSSRQRSAPGTPHRIRDATDDTVRLERGTGGSTPRHGQGLFATAKKAGNGIVETYDSPHHRAYDTSPVRLESQKMLLSPRRATRTISKVPFKVLDAPDLADDYYLNLVDWSSNDTLGVGLDKCVYLWSAKDSNVQKLVDLEPVDDVVTSLSWAGRGNHIAVGTKKGLVQIYDAEQLKLLRTMRGHVGRVGALAWNEHILTTGSHDRVIYHRDVRVPEHHIRELHGHKQEVCNLVWNTETNQLASGGNDNKLLVWDSLQTVPLHRFLDHKAAVKAIAWSPHQQGILASGGGTLDMKIRFWNTITGTLLSEIDTGSQVCNLMWSRTANEIISTHGFSSGKVQNQIQVWRYPSMQQVATLTGHTFRVLYLAMSPDGETIVTGAGDETLRFWDLNTPGKGQKSPSSVVRGIRTGARVGANSGSHTPDGGSLNPFAMLR